MSERFLQRDDAKIVLPPRCLHFFLSPTLFGTLNGTHLWTRASQGS